MMWMEKEPGEVGSACMHTRAPSSGYSHMPSTGFRMPVSHHSLISLSEGKKACVGSDINDITADARKLLILDMVFVLKNTYGA